MRAKIKETGNPAKIRHLNRNAVLSYLRAHQKTTRTELIAQLNLAPATVSAVVGELIDDSLVIEVAQVKQGKLRRGRPLQVLTLNASIFYMVGIVLRHEHDQRVVDYAWVDYSGNVSPTHSHVCSHGKNLDAVVEDVINALDKVIDKIGSEQKVKGICVGIPGVVNGRNVRFAPTLTAIEGEGFYQALQERIPYTVSIENDVNLWTQHELERALWREDLNFSCMLVSRGVGAGTVLNGALWRSSGWAGEIGSVRVPYGNNESRRLEWLISLDGYIAEKAREHGFNIDDSNSYPKDDPCFIEVIQNYAIYLSTAIEILISAFDLGYVILGTSNEEFMEYCMPYLESSLNDYPIDIKVILRKDLLDASVSGAASMALRGALKEIESRQI